MDQPTWIGRTLSGRYKIEALLGQGGMSAVYKATDPNLKRVVAIKLIHSHLSTDPSFVLRFESEAAAVASLRHPNIVQVYDFNNDNGVYYMVLEFIPGETLQDRMKRFADSGRQLPLDDALKFTANISDAVGYSHQRGMVHRDIKPANIMLDVHGQGILMDFGIVKILGGDSHTSTGAVVGTARYMSPEIIRGEVADHRADIYSLGVTLYEMLSGRPPFVADSAMTLMMMHLNDPVPNVRDFRGDIHPEIVDILEQCLAKNREDRYQSAAELSADLKRATAYIGGQPTSIRVPKSQPAQAEGKAPPPAQPKPAPVMQSASQSKPPPVRTQPPSGPATQASPAASRRGMWVIGAGLVGILCLAAMFIIGNSLLKGILQTSSGSTSTFFPTNATDSSSQSLLLNASQTLSPTDTPTETVIPTETDIPITPTPSTPYVLITGIRIQDGRYVVDYEVHNYPASPSLHVHMFFNTVPPEQAGSPGSGPWKLTWGAYGPPPFTKYAVSERPRDATQMCSLVANPDHSIRLNTGNCVDLPE